MNCAKKDKNINVRRETFFALLLRPKEICDFLILRFSWKFKYPFVASFTSKPILEKCTEIDGGASRRFLVLSAEYHPRP